MPSFQSMSMKRSRDDDSDSDDERYTMKSRPWGFHRTHDASLSLPSFPHNFQSFAASPQVPTSAFSAAPISSEGSSPASIQEEPFLLSPTPRGDDLDVDMDMTMDSTDFDMATSPPPTSSPFASTHFIRPAVLKSELFIPSSSPYHSAPSTGRIPTPIYPSFHRTTPTLTYPSSGPESTSTRSHWTPSPQNASFLIQPAPTHGRRHSKKLSISSMDHNSRIPPSITEVEDPPDTPTARTQSQLERLSVTTQFQQHHLSPSAISPLTPIPQTPGTPGTPTGGRKRSGALSGAGRFVMGYRDDCEKCRSRVPGHFSHIVP